MPGINSYGGSEVLLLSSNKIVLRRTLKELPTPDDVIQYLNSKAERVGYTRWSHDPSIKPDENVNREDDDDDDNTSRRNLEPLDLRVTTVAGVELPTRGASGCY